MIAADTLDVLNYKFLMWKSSLESRTLRVSMKKTKIMISGPNLNPPRDSGKHPCGICRKDVSRSSIFCNSCKHLVHKKCTNILGRLSADPSFRCDCCRGLACPIVGKQCNQVIIGTHELETVDLFYCLGDNLCVGGGCELASQGSRYIFLL